MFGSMKTEQLGKQLQKQLKEGCINEENRTGGHGFTSGVSPNKTNMLGEQTTAGQLTNHERIRASLTAALNRTAFLHL